MIKKLQIIFSSLFLVSIVYFSLVFTSNEANAHKAKNHKPMVCILEKDRTKGQKQNCKTALFFHRLCKIEQHCAILELERRKKELEDKKLVPNPNKMKWVRKIYEDY